MTRHVVALGTAALATALVACGGDSPAAAARASVDGTYVLSTINGASLPFTTDSTASKVVQVLSGQKVASIVGGGSLAVQSTEIDRTVSQPGSAVAVDTVKQSETVAFDGVNFATATYAATIIGDTMKVYSGNLTYAYLRAR